IANDAVVAAVCPERLGRSTCPRARESFAAFQSHAFGGFTVRIDADVPVYVASKEVYRQAIGLRSSKACHSNPFNPGAHVAPAAREVCHCLQGAPGVAISRDEEEVFVSVLKDRQEAQVGM